MATLAAAPGVAGAGSFPCSEQGVRQAVALGGGPHTFQCAGPTVVVTNSQIVTDRYVKLDGGGNLILDGNGSHRLFSVSANATLELRGLTLTHGFAASAIGGAVDSAGTLILEDVTVADNTAAYGGGIAGHILVVRNSRILRNTAVAGGGIYSEHSFISDSTIADNDASQSGGGMGNCGGTLDRTTLSGNTADTAGGGIAHDSGTCILTNSTISGNHSAGTGGGIALFDGGIELLNVTIADNTADGSYSALQLECCNTARFENVLVSGGCTNSMYVTISVGGSIESPGDGCGFHAASDQVLVPDGFVFLGPLADNGGSTETHAPLPYSPAIDGGVTDHCPDEDQRGMPRPVGASCDTGAVELPEPSQTALLLAGLAGLWGCRRRLRSL